MHLALFCPCEIPTFISWSKLAEPNRLFSFSAPTRDKHLFSPEKRGKKCWSCGPTSVCVSISVYLSEVKGDACHRGKYKAILIYIGIHKGIQSEIQTAKVTSLYTLLCSCFDFVLSVWAGVQRCMCRLRFKLLWEPPCGLYHRKVSPMWSAAGNKGPTVREAKETGCAVFNMTSVSIGLTLPWLHLLCAVVISLPVYYL